MAQLLCLLVDLFSFLAPVEHLRHSSRVWTRVALTSSKSVSFWYFFGFVFVFARSFCFRGRLTLAFEGGPGDFRFFFFDEASLRTCKSSEYASDPESSFSDGEDSLASSLRSSLSSTSSGSNLVGAHALLGLPEGLGAILWSVQTPRGLSEAMLVFKTKVISVKNESIGHLR